MSETILNIASFVTVCFAFLPPETRQAVCFLIFDLF